MKTPSRRSRQQQEREEVKIALHICHHYIPGQLPLLSPLASRALVGKWLALFVLGGNRRRRRRGSHQEQDQQVVFLLVVLQELSQAEQTN